MSDWIPEQDLEVAEFARKWKAGLENPADVTAFDWKQADVNAALAAINGFLAAWDAYQDNNSSGKRMTKDEARDAMKTAVRDFANSAVRFNKLMTDEQKLHYGIHPVDRTHTPAPAPETFPEAGADTSVIRQLTVHFWDSATKKLKFDEADRGKRVFFCLRWESTINLKGPASEIYSAVIP